MKIYVGMALTNAPESFREGFQHELKSRLRKIESVEILDFIGLQGGTAEAVYLFDRQCTETADLCVFIADYDSIGLGMEIAYRQMVRKPMLVFARDTVRVTRMVLGMCEVEKEQAYFCRYQNIDEIVRVISHALGAGFFGNHHT